MSKSGKVVIYCDGACSGNQHKSNTGGWGTVIQYLDKQEELYGGEINTTNQRMELISCIKGLEALKQWENREDITVEVYSDSSYLVNCINQGWYRRWLINNWQNSYKKPVENRDLWERLLNLYKIFPDIKFIKVKGHCGIELNEMADKLANKGINIAKGVEKIVK